MCYPLIPLMTTPCTKYFWQNRYSASTGKMVRKVIAINGPMFIVPPY